MDTGRDRLLSWPCHGERHSCHSDHGSLYPGKPCTSERETETVERIEVSPVHLPWKGRSCFLGRMRTIAIYTGLDPAVGMVLATSGWGWHSKAGIHALRLIKERLMGETTRSQVHASDKA